MTIPDDDMFLRDVHSAYDLYNYFVLMDFLEPKNDVIEYLSVYHMSWQLSETEADVFKLEGANISRLYWAYERYESFIGTTENDFAPYRESERQRYAHYFRGECVRELETAGRFMAESCNLPPVLCLAWVLKLCASEIRGGIINA